MKLKSISQYFGGRYMKFWYVAFVLVMGWFVLGLVNRMAVSSYELTGYDSNGNVVGTKIVDMNTMTNPDRLPVTKSYKPIKPVKFLD